MKLNYYPGCTMKNHAKNFEDSAIGALKKLDIEVVEIPRWNCCGTVYSLATDDLMHHVAPIRNLLRVKEMEDTSDDVMTLCSMCYNTLKRSNERVKREPDSLKVINDLMYKEDIKYEGDVNIFHLLEFLRDKFSFDAIEDKVVKPLEGLKVASYYGCTLLRPKEVAFDDEEDPTIMEELVTALGAEAVDFSQKSECCGSYQTVNKPNVVAEQTNKIVSSAQHEGADVIVVSCPLCAFNLDRRQKEAAKLNPELKQTPILYFTQLMAIALGCEEHEVRLDLHHIDPNPLLGEKGLVG